MSSRVGRATRGAGPARFILVAVFVLTASACDESANLEGARDREPGETGPPSDAALWGCKRSIPELPKHLDPRWREEAIVVGDFGFYGMAGDFAGHRPHGRSDIQVKLPITIEGNTGVVVWLPRDEYERGSLIMSDVPRRGPGNSYRVEDGHRAVRFEACSHREWTGWTAGLALADRREIALMVKEDTAARATPVVLGPWEVDRWWPRSTRRG
jgi:hypothetical protein